MLFQLSSVRNLTCFFACSLPSPDAVSCSTKRGEEACAEMDASCVVRLDGYYVQVSLSARLPSHHVSLFLRWRASTKQEESMLSISPRIETACTSAKVFHRPADRVGSNLLLVLGQAPCVSRMRLWRSVSSRLWQHLLTNLSLYGSNQPANISTFLTRDQQHTDSNTVKVHIFFNGGRPPPRFWSKLPSSSPLPHLKVCHGTHSRNRWEETHLGMCTCFFGVNNWRVDVVKVFPASTPSCALALEHQFDFTDRFITCICATLYSA